MRGVLEAERHRRAALLPPNVQCEVCGESDPLALEADVATLLCADHAALASGREPIEEHHLAGRRWLIVLDLTTNWHRIVTALQRSRKGVTKGSTAELLYGIADLIYAIADYVKRLEKTNSPKPTKSPAQ